jgi:hypothetical protein
MSTYGGFGTYGSFVEQPTAVTTDFGYKVRIKEEIIDALRSAFGDGGFPNRDLLGNVKITLDYPTDEISYPAIMVELSERQIQIAGVGHRELGEDDAGKQILLAHWRFQADVRFTIFGLTSADRDMLSSALVSMIAFPGAYTAYRTFQQEIFDSEFIDMQIIGDHVDPGGDSIQDVPWDDPTRKLYVATYSIPIIGEFFATHDTGELINISDVKVYPYRADQTEPTGSTDPRDTNEPWV